jgi:hypothetical protein
MSASSGTLAKIFILLFGFDGQGLDGVDSQRLDGIAGRAMDLTGRTSPAFAYAAAITGCRRPGPRAITGAGIPALTIDPMNP